MVHGASLKEVSQSHAQDSGGFPEVFGAIHLTFSHPSSLMVKKEK